MIADAPTSLSLRERAAIAWREQQLTNVRRERERLDRMRYSYREGLVRAIESTLGELVSVSDVTCDLPDECLDRSYVGVVATAELDGLTLVLAQANSGSLYLELRWWCPRCDEAPVTDMRVKSLEDLGHLLDHLPTLCRCEVS